VAFINYFSPLRNVYIEMISEEEESVLKNALAVKRSDGIRSLRILYQQREACPICKGKGKITPDVILC